MKITVTKEHIKKGKPNLGYACPIALAVREQLHLSAVEVHVDGAGITAGTMDYEIPRAAVLFFWRFDEGKSVKPFSFNLKPLEARA